MGSVQELQVCLLIGYSAQLSKVGAAIIPIIQTRKLKHRETELPAGEPAVSRHHLHDLGMDRLAPGFTCFAPTPYGHLCVQNNPRFVFFLTSFSVSPPLRTVFGAQWLLLKNVE